MTSKTNSTLRKLSDSGKQVSLPAEDVRGRRVKDNEGKNNEGKNLGKMHDLLIDDQEHKVRFLLVEHGGFLGMEETMSFISIDAITKITADDVVIDHGREHVALAPAYDPELVEDRAYHSALYGHYGINPYEGSCDSYPGAFLGWLSGPPLMRANVSTRSISSEEVGQLPLRRVHSGGVAPLVQTARRGGGSDCE